MTIMPKPHAHLPTLNKKFQKIDQNKIVEIEFHCVTTSHEPNHCKFQTNLTKTVRWAALMKYTLIASTDRQAFNSFLRHTSGDKKQKIDK